MTLPCIPAFAAALPMILIAASVLAEDVPRPEPIGKPATKVYRQVMPGGRVIYSDKPVKGARVEETITVEPAPPGTPSGTVSGNPPPLPMGTVPTPVDRVTVIPSTAKPRTADDANADVIRAELLLEDARKRMEAGAEPLPGERVGTASGGSRLSDDYHARQKRLAEEVAVAENVLKKAVAERDALREGR